MIDLKWRVLLLSESDQIKQAIIEANNRAFINKGLKYSVIIRECGCIGISENPFDCTIQSGIQNNKILELETFYYNPTTTQEKEPYWQNIEDRYVFLVLGLFDLLWE